MSFTKRKAINVNTLSWCLLFKTLQDGDCLADELLEKTGLSRAVLYERLRYMEKQKVAHVCEWERDSYGRPTVAVWRLGEGKRAPKPKQTKSERNQKYRERRKRKKLPAVVNQEAEQ